MTLSSNGSTTLKGMALNDIPGLLFEPRDPLSLPGTLFLLPWQSES